MAIKLTKKQAEELQQFAELFEQARAALAERLDKIASEWEAEFYDKSERWQEGEAGQAAREKIGMARSWFDKMPSEGDLPLYIEALL